MELGLRGKTALITGGNKGIGRGIAEEFAREGVNLHLAARSQVELEEVQREVTARFGVNCDIHPRDLSQRDVRDELARDCSYVDILVNCAGAVPGGGIDQVSEDVWRAGWELKVYGFIGITRIIYKEMCRRKRGVIINIVGTGRHDERRLHLRRAEQCCSYSLHRLAGRCQRTPQCARLRRQSRPDRYAALSQLRRGH